MNASRELQELREALQAAFAGRPRPVTPESAASLRQRLANARDALAPPRGHRALPRLAQAVMSFRLQGTDSPWPELKYCAHACAHPVDWGGRVLIDETPLFEQLLAAIGALHGHPFRECYRGLLCAWLGDLADPDALGPGARRNAARLENFLENGRRRLPPRSRPGRWETLLAQDGLQRSATLCAALGIKNGKAGGDAP